MVIYTFYSIQGGSLTPFNTVGTPVVMLLPTPCMVSAGTVHGNAGTPCGESFLSLHGVPCGIKGGGTDRLQRAVALAAGAIC